MSDILDPGAQVIFMKIGMHAGEALEDIIARKQEEYRDTGRIFWGYGGSTCHPTGLVQPFAREAATHGADVKLVMSPMDSKHAAAPELAREYSEDGIRWEKIPEGIHVRGSRYAMILGALQRADLDLDLRDASVALGPSRGMRAHEYIRGRVDKGCLVIDSHEHEVPGTEEVIKHIGLYARLMSPYAVFLK